MPEPQQVLITIDNINDGAMREAFDIEMKKVLANIQDANTPATAAREITLKVRLKPHGDRIVLDTVFTCTSRLANIEPHTGRMFLGRTTEGDVIGLTEDQRQQVLFEPVKVAMPESKVVNFTPTK